MTERACQREPEQDGWHECHRCEALWGKWLHETGWRPSMCPEWRGSGEEACKTEGGK